MERDRGRWGESVDWIATAAMEMKKNEVSFLSPIRCDTTFNPLI